MRTIICSIAFLLVLTTAAQAKCDPELAPYYHRQENGPGALLADIFLFPGALVIGVAAAPHAVPRKRADDYGGAELSRHPLCMAGFLAQHFVSNRPVRVEHYRR